jgi:GTP pyrophosphokinase
MDWEKIYDLVAARIIVPTVTDCYATLGVLHKLWHPVPGRIKDFIATPRPTGYQSLHTTVFAHKGIMVEFQIRTPEMHEVAEKGIAAHWLYDEMEKTKYRRKFQPNQPTWVRQLKEWQDTFSRGQSEEFLKSLKIDFFHDRIFVFTPKGDIIDLPEGATPVDFAFQIHSAIGEQCAGAKVNGKMVALNEPLISADIVEIITAKHKKPSPDWLKFVKTSEARRRIQQALKVHSPAHFKASELKAQFRIVVKDRIGLLKDINTVFSRHKINVVSSNTGLDKNKKDHVLVFTVAAPPACNIERVGAQLEKVKSVQQCQRLTMN